MSRLPSALQPAWPLFKRAHRLLSLLLGIVFRRTSRLAGDRAVPRTATTRSARTAELEPEHVRLHQGGPGEKLVRPQPVGEPADHWAFHSWLEYDVPGRYTMEIDGGVVVGDYAASITPDGILDYETSDYFGVSGWREHPIYLRPMLPRIEDVEGSLLSLATRGTIANYYHFLLDVLPRWGIFQECLPGRTPDAVYLPTGARYQKQLLAMVGLEHLPVVELGKHRALRAEHLLVPSTPNQTLACPTWVAQWLRANLPPSGATGLPKKLYVTRGDKPNTRRLVDEPELMPLLEDQGFVRLDPGSISVQEQIDWFAAADVIVAPHGAALSNLVFAKPGVRILELFAPNYVNPYWAIAENVPDAKYRYVVDEPETHGVGKPMTGVLTDIKLSAKQVLGALDDLVSA